MANNVITGELVNGAMTVLNGALQFLNTGLGTTLTQVTLFSGAIYGLVAKIGAMKVIPAITNSFKIFGAIMKGGVAGGIAAAGKGATALTAVLSGSLPVILGVVAALALLAKGYKAIKDSQDYDLQLSKLQDIQSEYDSQTKRMQELDELGGQRTKAEEAELEVLKQQTAELKAQRDIQRKKADRALSKEVKSAMFGTRDYYADDGTYVVEQYNKAQEQFTRLAEMSQSLKDGEKNSRAYRLEIQDFISTWGDYADKLAQAAEEGKELKDYEIGLISTVSMARAEQDYLNETYGEFVDNTNEASNALDEYAQRFEGLPDRIKSATDALQKFKDATSTDYSAPIKEYQSVYDDLSEKIASGTANMDEIRAAVDLYLPEGTFESLNYDLEAAAGLLGQRFSDKLGAVLSASDPLGGLVQVIQDGGGELVTSSGVVAARIDENNRLSIESYELLAEALGTTEDFAKSLGLAIQDQSAQYFFTQQELNNMSEALASAGINAANSQDNLAGLISTIAEVGNTADPAVIAAWVSALQEINAVDANVQITAQGVDEALNGTEEVGDAVKDIPEEKTTTITALVQGLGQVEDLATIISRIYSKKADIETNIILKVNGQPVTLDQYRSLHLAKGTDYSSGGLALVNDGAPINGSSAELIVEGDTARIANGGKTGITKLEHGAKVYTAAETQQILKNSQNGKTDLAMLLSGIKAFGSGTGEIDVSRYITPPSNYDPNASGTIRPSSSNPETRKEEFDEWLKEKKHYLAMDIITEAEYYRDLEIMNERYLKGQKDYLDEYWQHQEEIYQYQKRDLKDIIDLEEKLNNLAKAKTQKVLVYKDGMFQYIQNTEAIAKAQRAVSGYANGTTSSTAGVHMVGENGPELRVLGEGEGIIPANITKNLMRLGSMGSGSFNRLGNTEVNNFNIGKVLLEKVNDVDGLFNGLKNLAMQTATARA